MTDSDFYCRSRRKPRNHDLKVDFNKQYTCFEPKLLANSLLFFGRMLLSNFRFHSLPVREKRITLSVLSISLEFSSVLLVAVKIVLSQSASKGEDGQSLYACKYILIVDCVITVIE